MATAAKIAADYGFGARAPWAAFRASEYDMKERARLSGLFPQVNNEPLSNTLNALVEAFKKNAALGAILERRRALEGRAQYVLQSQEAMDAVNRNLAPWARVGRAVEAKSARMAQRIAGVPERAPDAADVMTDADSSIQNRDWARTQSANRRLGGIDARAHGRRPRTPAKNPRRQVGKIQAAANSEEEIQVWENTAVQLSYHQVAS